MTLVIGLHGAKGSGKDQFYKAVKAAFPQLDVRKIAYADPIKNEVLNIFGLETEEQYDEFKRTDLTFTVDKGYTWRQTAGRRAVREIGMLMRRYDEQQFVRYVEDQIKAAPQAVWLITDVRFDNSPTGLKNGKFEKEVEFGYQEPLDLDKLNDVLYNIQVINRMCG